MTDLQQHLQEQEYDFPYHWLPHRTARSVKPGRFLSWGFRYLTLCERLVAEAAEETPARIVDVGCGDGRLLYMLAGTGAEVTGVEPVAAAAEFASAFGRQVPRLTVLTTTLEKAQLTPSEVVCAVEVLEHVEDRSMPDFSARLADAVAPNGALLVTVPSTNVPLADKHYRHYDVDLLIEQLGPSFVLEHAEFLDRISRAGDVFMRMLVNRYLVVTDDSVLRAAEWGYRRWLFQASPSTGRVILAKFRRRN